MVMMPSNNYSWGSLQCDLSNLCDQTGSSDAMKLVREAVFKMPGDFRLATTLLEAAASKFLRDRGFTVAIGG
jgi:hypothetical protein